jgi:hypothetical protein
MKSWLGGDAAPADWDGGEVQWIERAGHTRIGMKQPEQPWAHGAENWFDIIAYTPTPSPEIAEQPMGQHRIRAVRMGETTQLFIAGLGHTIGLTDDEAQSLAAGLAAATPKPADPTSVAGERNDAVERIARDHVQAFRQQSRLSGELPSREAKLLTDLFVQAMLAALAINAPDAAKPEGRT